MASHPEMRQPYGPGWHDADWTPQGPPDAEDAGAAPAALPRVSRLAEFMAVVQRLATPVRPQPALRVAPVDRRHPVAGTAAYVGQTRRWVIAGGAGLLAISSLPPLPRSDPEKTDAAPDAGAPADSRQDSGPRS